MGALWATVSIGGVCRGHRQRVGLKSRAGASERNSATNRSIEESESEVRRLLPVERYLRLKSPRGLLPATQGFPSARSVAQAQRFSRHRGANVNPVQLQRPREVGKKNTGGRRYDVREPRKLEPTGILYRSQRYRQQTVFWISYELSHCTSVTEVQCEQRKGNRKHS